MTLPNGNDVPAALKAYREALERGASRQELNDLTHQLIMMQDDPAELIKGIERVAAEVEASKT